MFLKNLINVKTEKIIVRPRFLWFLMMAYAMTFVTANWFDPRLINIFGLNTGAGAIIFPCTYLLSDAITEVYGYKNARFSIWIGFLCNITVITYAYLITYFPDQNSINMLAFTSFTNANKKVVIASLISYLISESINSYLMSKLKIKLKGKYLGIRFILSIILANAINLILFCPLAFYGSIKNKELILFTITSWIFMIFIELLFVPFSIRLAKKLKIAENMDIYDKKTNFNIFSLEVDYSTKDNEFEKHNECNDG